MSATLPLSSDDPDVHHVRIDHDVLTGHGAAGAVLHHVVRIRHSVLATVNPERADFVRFVVDFHECPDLVGRDLDFHGLLLMSSLSVLGARRGRSLDLALLDQVYTKITIFPRSEVPLCRTRKKPLFMLKWTAKHAQYLKCLALWVLGIPRTLSP